MTNSNASKSAMVIDDEPELAELMGQRLRHLGFNVEVFGDGAAALERLALTSFDVVVTDIRMPKVSGASICRFLTESHKTTRIVVTSGYAGVEPELDRMGISKILRKPFSWRTFDAMVCGTDLHE